MRIQDISAIVLESAERLFLFVHGWVRREDGHYDPPASYQAGSRKKHGNYTRSHAVNSQKQYVYNHRNGGTRTDPDLAKQTLKADSLKLVPDLKAEGTE